MTGMMTLGNGVSSGATTTVQPENFNDFGMDNDSAVKRGHERLMCFKRTVPALRHGWRNLEEGHPSDDGGQ